MTTVRALLSTKRDATLLRWAAAMFLVWISCTGPLRWMAGAALPSWLLGSAPNFFAGLTLTFWQAFVVPGRPVAAAGVALAVLGLVELSQLAMPQHRSDPWDLLASLMGCSLAAVALCLRRRVSQHTR